MEVKGYGIKTILKYLIVLLVPEFISCYSYPVLGTKHYLSGEPIRRSAYFPLPLTQHQSQYQLPDYEDGLIASSQDDYEYSPYDKSFVQLYPAYNSGRNYYNDKTMRRSSGFGYYNDPNLQDSIREFPDEIDPYAHETWYENDQPRYDSNANANAMFLQNLIMAQMYEDSKNRNRYAYDSTADDYDDQHWLYGVPTTKVEETERVKEFFRKKGDDEVRELQMLAGKKDKNKNLIQKESKIRKLEKMNKLMKSKPKMTENEYFDLQKQIIVNNRKNNRIPFVERFNKKQNHNPVDMTQNFWDLSNPRSRLSGYPETATSSIKKLNLIRDDKNTKDKAFSDSKNKIKSTAATMTSTASPKKLPTVGQKEVVLPRPSNPIRRPLPEISTRSLNEASMYDTIQQLLSMENDLQQSKISQPQKRFVLNEDQLTAELSGLKKLTP